MVLFTILEDPTMSKDFIQAIGTVVGIMLAIPMLVLLFKIAMFVGSIKSLADTTSRKLEVHITKVENMLEVFSQRVTDSEKKIAVLWDGRERRSGSDRRDDA